MATQDTAVQQRPGQRRYVYGGYKGKGNPSEREKILHLLDEYRCTEGFVAEYLPKWIEVSPHVGLKGGLHMIQQREAAHARVMAARLRALGEVPRATIPAERREREIPFFGSAERSDVEKLQVLANLFGDPNEFLKPVTDLIEQIQEDQQSKELLRAIMDDERASIKWLVEMYQTLSATKAAAQ